MMNSTNSEIRLYITKSAPNSIRAEENFLKALNEFHEQGTRLYFEIIDVFSKPDEALTDGVITTPTLVCAKAYWRQILLGDLTDSTKLRLLLQSLYNISKE